MEPNPQQMDLAPAPSPAEASLKAVEKEVHYLGTLFQLLLVMLIVLVCSLDLVLFRQILLIRRQAAEFAKAVELYEKVEMPALQDFFNRLKSFASTNQDFVPIMNKYFGSPSPAAAPTPGQPAAPPPGAAPPPKK